MATLAGSPASPPPPILLWSASCELKYKISAQYYGYQYAWCSPVFEAATLPKFAVGSAQPPSSDPVTIYRQLHAAVSCKDRHDKKIEGFKKSLRAIAIKSRNAGVITKEHAAEIATRVSRADFQDWKPLMYVIPYANVASRVQLVPIQLRASDEPEYIIPDLQSHEFQVIELTPCP